MFSTIEEVKREAEATLQTFRELNSETNVSLGHCYEVLARRNGHKSWRAYKRTLANKRDLPKAPNSEISPEEFSQLAVNPIPHSWSPVTVENYSAAINTLLEVANMRGTSGSRAASVLLLNLYNGHEWRFDLIDLSVLTDKYYAAAITAIRGRSEVCLEPQRLIENGSQIFKVLWDRWMRFHISNIGKLSCWDCNGSGKGYVDEDNESSEEMRPCDKCNGTGLVERIQ